MMARQSIGCLEGSRKAERIGTTERGGDDGVTHRILAQTLHRQEKVRPGARACSAGGTLRPLSQRRRSKIRRPGGDDLEEIEVHGKKELAHPVVPCFCPNGRRSRYVCARGRCPRERTTVSRGGGPKGIRSSGGGYGEVV